MIRLRLAAVLLALLASSTLRAADFAIDLKAQAGKETTAAAKAQPRTVHIAAVGTPITIKWTVRNTDKAEAVKDVLVHFFVVKIEKPDQQEVPKLTKGVLAESALTMDFKSQDRRYAVITITAPAAGCYLIRVELKGAADKDGREPFAALDLVMAQTRTAR